MEGHSDMDVNRLNEEREREAMEMQAERDNDEYMEFLSSRYDDWLGDNIISLRADFIEELYQQEFDDYCAKVYKDVE